jgi:hypothetical protein
MSTTAADLTLTCRTIEAPRFVELGLTPLRVRGELTDLEGAHLDTPQATLLLAGCHGIAEDGVPFYGHCRYSQDARPVVFAAEDNCYIEVPACPDRLPLVRIQIDADPESGDLVLARAYLRCLAAAVAVLAEPNPWLPVPRQEIASLMDCACRGRGWFLECDEESGPFRVIPCGICCQYDDLGLVGLLANTQIERGWP